MHKYLIISVLFSVASLVSAQEGSSYNIGLVVKGNENSFISIAYHLGDKQYIKDTIYTDQEGKAIFSGQEALDQGLYMVVMPDNSYFEMIIPADQHFDIYCTSNDFAGTLRFEGSDENSTFLDYQKGWVRLQERAMNIRKRAELNRESSDSTEYLLTRQKEIESAMMSYLKQYSDAIRGTILSALLNAMVPVQVPDFEVPFNSPNPDSVRWLLSYNYNVDHFFDNTDLTDSRLIRTPVLYNKINNFFSNVIIQHPDTIIRQMNRVVKMAEPDPVVFRFIVVYLFNHFRESQIMGHDAILVDLADRYYLSGRANWASDEFRSDLKKDVDRLRNNLIGKKAVDLTMETYGGLWKSLYDIRSEFIILYFWEPGCGHCKTTTPILKELYGRLKAEGVEVFAICTQNNRDEWESYIAENELEWINGWDPLRETHFDYYYNINSTPMVYILNRDKVIIAKKLPVESIGNFIANYRKYGM